MAAKVARELAAFGFKPFEDDRDLTVSTTSATITEGTPGAEALIEEALRDLHDPDHADLPRTRPAH